MKTLKKTLLATALIALLICAFSLIASAATYGDLTYTVSNGEVTITDCSTSVTSVIIPSEINGYPVTSIGSYAFSYCDSLESVTIPDSVTSIGDDAFSNCTNLASITVDENNMNYSSDEYGVLYNKDKTTLIQYPIGNKRTSFEIPDSVTSIGSYAFYYCTSLASVEIPNSVTSIGANAFSYCDSLESVTIPDSVKSIGDSAFCGCTGLTSITVDEANKYYSNDENGVLFNKDKTSLIQYPIGNPIAEYEIPYSVTSIGSHAFSYFTGLTSITIPDSVTSIGDDAFYNCSGLTSITIPDSVTSIGNFAFGCCTSLTSVTIGDSVKRIDGDAFYGCYMLKFVYYNGTHEDWNRISIYSDNNYLLSATLCCKHLIKYDANGGTGAPENQIKEYGNPLTLSTTVPEREGYNFLGWSTSADGEVEYNPGDNYSKNEDVSLYAIWEITKYTITYDENGGTGAPESQIKTYGTNLVLSDIIPEREGYNFLGWSTTSDGEVEYNPGDTYTKNEIVTLYAVWKEITYSVTYQFDGGTIGPQTQEKHYWSDLILTDKIPERMGYTFLGWATSADGEVEYNPGDTYMANEPLTLYAVWEAKKYTISYDANGGTGAPGSQEKTYGTDITLSTVIPEREGYNFKGWSKSSTATSASYSSGSTYSDNSNYVDVTLYAVWSEKTYSVSYNSNGGSSAPSNQTKNYFDNLVLTTSIPDKTNYIFVGWSTSSDGKVEYLPGDAYTVNEPMILYAKWVGTDSIALDGDTDAVTGQEISYDIYLSLSNSLDYLISTVKYPKHFIYKEIINKDFIDNIVDTQYSDDEYNYITIISTYDYDGARTQANKGYIPYEIVFDVAENCPIGTYTITFGEDTIGIGDADYTFILGEINVFVPDALTINGSDSISSAAQYKVSGVNTPEVPVYWSVDNDEVATISADGVLTPITNGTVVITATYTENDTIFATKTVTVKDNDVTAIDIIGSDTVYDGEKYYAKIYPENLNSKNIKWSVDNSEVAEITEDGVLTAVSAGTVTVRATVDDAKAFYEEMTVTIPSVNTVIDSLSTDIGTWDKAFVPYERNYTVVVPADTASIAVTGSFTGGSLKCNATTMLNGRARTITLDSDVTTLTLARANVGGKNDSSYTVTVVRSVPYIIANVTVVGGKYRFDIDAVTLPEGVDEATIVLAVYDEQGVYSSMQSKTITSDDTTAQFDVETDEVCSYQVMVFESIELMKPVCQSVKDDI